MRGFGWTFLWACTLGGACSGTKVPDGTDEGVFGTDGDTDPVVEITAPADGQHLYSDTKTRFAGVVLDTPDDPVDLEAWWRSDLEGRLSVEARPDGDGQVEDFGTLLEGDHALTLTAVDTAGHVTTQSIVVQVGPPNTPPSCAILYPEDGAGGVPGQLLMLTAEVFDPDVPADGLDILWQSDLAGELGSPRASTDGTVVLPIDTLGPGTHVISLTVTDDVGASCLDQVVYGVGEGPAVTITAPLDGAVVAEGESVRLTGSVSDFTGPVSDLDLSWTSSRDGVLFTGSPDSDGLTVLDISGLSSGVHSIVLSATNTLGLSDTDVISIQVDSPPSQPDVVIGPRPATSTDDLVAVITSPSVDPEGESIVYSYTWYQNGALYSGSTSTTVDAAVTTRDEEWRLVVTPSDGVLTGRVGEAVTTIANSPPVVDAIAVSPVAPVTGDELSCETSVSDADADTVTVDISWAINGVTVAATGPTMASDWTAKGDTVSCTAVIADGTDDGDPITSGAVIIGNTAPSIGEVHITPDTLYADETATCTYSSYMDVDGDADVSAFEWSINGVVVASSATLSSGFRKDDVVRCQVTPSDGLADGTSVEDSVIVANTLPSFEFVEMVPRPAWADDTITCTAFGFVDPDGDPDDSYVIWSVNGGVTAIGGALSGMFVGGDVVTCVVTPYDGEEEGWPVGEGQTIMNSAPTLTGVRVSPTDATASDVLTCESIGYSDIDGDPEASQYVWLINDSEAGVTSPTLSSGFTAGDRVTCLLTVSDGESAGTTLSDTVTIENHAPVITGLSLGPIPVQTDTVLHGAVTAEDEDGDHLSVNYGWAVNGAAVSETSENLDGAEWFDRGDEITLTVTVSDGASTSEPETVGPVVVENSPPVAPVVSVAPVDPVEEEDDLYCEIAVESIDPDGDPVSYTLAWFVDGEAFTEVDTTVLVGDAISSSHTQGNQAWTCTATPSDGLEEGPAGSSTVDITPAVGRAADEAVLSCKELLELWPLATTGIYWIDPTGEDAFEAHCDMDTDGGGWTRVAVAPTSAGAPSGWGLSDAIDRDACVDEASWCRFSRVTIEAIMEVGPETADRFRLVAPDLPIHTHYYWSSTSPFDPGLTMGSSSWWSVALELGGAHSGGCQPLDASGVGHEPDGCTTGFGTLESHRVYWYRPDIETVGADSPGRYFWYAR